MLHWLYIQRCEHTGALRAEDAFDLARLETSWIIS